MPRKKKFLSHAFVDAHTPLYQSISLDNAEGLQLFCDSLHKKLVPFQWEYRQGQASPLQPPVRQAVVPVFLPFRGCPVRCVFCAQDVQTGLGPSSHKVSGHNVSGHKTDNRVCSDLADASGQTENGQPAAPRAGKGITDVLDEARQNLRQRHEGGQPPAELAFYGGTFTALPEHELDACLTMARVALENGWISTFRCSTRPDRVDAPMLERLRNAGCGVVELGVQSFADSALAASRRGYTGATALAACATVLAAGLKLGVQLLPGMPGHTPHDFARDVPTALAAGAHMLRFYPCLVLEGTGLAAMWREGSYVPWSLEPTLDALAQGWLAAMRAGVPVIRMGLAPEDGLVKAILAGPVDAELGGRVKGRALLLAVREALTASDTRQKLLAENGFALRLPKAVQGYFWGARGELRPAWATLGLRAVAFEKQAEPQILLVSSQA